jgi:hypothetical protein
VTKPGPLLAADELLSHQIVDTFARVGQSDRSWTEKIWAMAAARDGSLSVAFGLGKYINRDVLDGFAGVSRGTEQWTVRASRRLAPHLERTEVGPISYDIAQPLRCTRYRLAANDVVPISFDVEVEGVAPPGMEERETHISRSRSRIDADIMRFHQSGVARGWVEVEGERTTIDDQAWVGARDRSWGVRYGIGLPQDDIEAAPVPADTSGMFVWMPVTMTRPDGRSFTLFVYYQRYQGAGWSTGSARGAIELSDGRSTSSPPSSSATTTAASSAAPSGPCWPMAPSAPTGWTRCPRPASTSAPASTAASTVTTKGSGEASSPSRASTLPTATPWRWPTASTSTATASSASRTSATGPPASAPCSPTWSAPTPRWASPRPRRSARSRGKGATRRA